jgi:exosortase
MNADAGRPADRYSVSWTALVLLAAMWTWAIWTCAEHWIGNPNYSYGWAVPLLVLGFGIRRYVITANKSVDLSPSIPLPRATCFFAAGILGLLGFLLEYSREQIWHPQIVLWSICLLVASATLVILYIEYGARLARAELFPVLFFLSAAPWPPRLEQPITSTLMRWVASITAEVLHWLGVEAQAAGGAIALPSGLVGITEACSGIRSLQAGIMFGLAMGEWFLLRPARRLVLVLVAIAFAFATNLIRTVALTLAVDQHGPESLDRYHDLIGNIMITLLIVAIWLIGKLLAPAQHAISATNDRRAPRPRGFAREAPIVSSAMLRSVTVTFLAGLLCARILSAALEAHDRTQTAPFFVARIDSKNNKQAAVPTAVWNELHPTSGEYIRHENLELPGGGADCFHFFWKPSPWNRFALVHRPDICMPGVGWASDGPAEPRDVKVDGYSIRCYLFRFRRQNAYALELWGAWRNGEPVSIDYRPEQVLGALPAPGSLHLEGKRRSATEIVACNLITPGSSPDPEIAVALLQSVFDYKPDESTAIRRTPHAQ